MAYLFKQKLDLRGLAGSQIKPKLVVVAEPEEYLLALYSYYLRNHEFTVRHCLRPQELLAIVKQEPPHLLIFNPRCYKNISISVRLLQKLKSQQPFLQIVTICEGISNQELKQLMTCGVASHLDRHLTKPQDLVIIAKTLLGQV